MNSTERIDMTDEEIEKLLRLRHARKDPRECPELEKLALVISDQATAEEHRAAKEHLKQCDLCSEAVLVLQGMLSTGKVEPLPEVTRTAPLRRLLGSLRAFWGDSRLSRAALVISLAAVVGVVFVWMWKTHGPSEQSEEESMVWKGEPDSFYVAVQRGTNRFSLRTGEQLKMGDHLGLFYSSSSSGFLAIFDLDDQGVATLLFPAGGTNSAAIQPKFQEPLADGGIVREGQGCEWMVAVFSDRALNTDRLREQIESAERNSQDCELQVSIPEARAIKILSTRR